MHYDYDAPRCTRTTMLQCYDTARPRCTTTATHYDELRPRCAKIHCDLDALRIVYQQCSLIGRSTGRTATSITTADCIGSSQYIITVYHHNVSSQCIITVYHHSVSSQCIITVYHHCAMHTLPLYHHSVSSQYVNSIITVYHCFDNAFAH
jgi:hypothetical protein